MIGHLYLLSENVHWLKGFRVGPTSIKCCKVYELSASFQLWLLDEFRCRKRIPNRTQCVLGSASVADVKRSENKLYNTMNDETIMKCNHNLLHEQNWLITRPVHKFRKFLLPVDFPKEERSVTYWRTTARVTCVNDDIMTYKRDSKLHQNKQN